MTMYLSVISNIINVIGNLIGVLVLRAGVAGVAYPSLIARTFFSRDDYSTLFSEKK